MLLHVIGVLKYQNYLQHYTIIDVFTAQYRKSDDTQIGPTLPPALRAKLEAHASSSTQEVDSGAISDSEPTNAAAGGNSDSESDSEVIGPLPPDHPKAQQAVISSSNSSTSEAKKPKREEWMLVPPKNKIIPGLGLGPRKFLTRAPQDSKMSDEEDEEEAFAREADAEIEKKLIDEYDQKMDEMKKDFEVKKRRGESLYEMHQQDLKKKKNVRLALNFKSIVIKLCSFM